MKIPTLQEAEDAIGKLSGSADAIRSAASLVETVVGLFTNPADQDKLKAKFAETESAALASLDRLDAAIDEAEKAPD